jgi:pyridoxal phosphate enzyme (YggS family)
VRSEIEANLTTVRGRIAAAADRAGRKADEIKLIAVSKTHPADVLREAINAGATMLGENKVQEADGKITELGRRAAEWHLIGHLQSNKARRAVQLFDVIHSVDSIELASRLERICGEEGRESLNVLLQVDLAGEATKSGLDEIEVERAVTYLGTCQYLKLIGLMTLPPFFGDAEQVRPYFKRVRELRDRILPDGELSMGMSHDLEPAVEEGATMVRVGTAIFGSRGK